MQFSHALIALVAAGLANAQLPDVPSCSLNCFVSALTSDGCSSLTDFKCHCAKPQLVSQITPCVQKACEVADQSSVSNIVVSQCSAAGEPISIPAIGGATTASATATAATTTSTSAATTATGSASGSASGSFTSSAAGSSSSHASSSSGGSTTTGSVPHASSGGSSTASSTSSQFTGAASGNAKGNIGGIAALAMAAVAYL